MTRGEVNVAERPDNGVENRDYRESATLCFLVIITEIKSLSVNRGNGPDSLMILHRTPTCG